MVDRPDVPAARGVRAADRRGCPARTSIMSRIEQRLAVGPGLGRDSTATRCRVGARRCGPACRSGLELSSGASAGHPRRLRAVRHRPGARPGRWGQQPRQHAPRAARLVPTEWVLLDIRIDARRQRVRPRRRAPLVRGRHAAGHRQPVDHRAPLRPRLSPRPARPSRRGRRRSRPRSEHHDPPRLRHDHPLRRGAAPRSSATGSWSWPTWVTPTCGPAEANGADAFTPLALASVWAPSLRLGTAIVPGFTRGPALLAQCVASLADAAPGRFVFGIGTSSNVIVERLERHRRSSEPYKRTRTWCGSCAGP